MLGTIANLYSYSTAPRTRYFLQHPVKAMAARRTVKRMTGRTAKRIAAGVGAAALAVPVGIWLGQKVARG